MFAPSTCSSVASHAAFLEIDVLRGRDSVDGRAGSVLVRPDGDPVAGHRRAIRRDPSRGEAVRSAPRTSSPVCANDVGAAMPWTRRVQVQAVTRVRGEASSKCALQPSASNDGADKRDLLGRRKRGHEMCTARAEELVRRS